MHRCRFARVFALAALSALLCAAPASAHRGASGWRLVKPQKAKHGHGHKTQSAKTGATTDKTSSRAIRFADRVGFTSHTSYLSQAEGYSLWQRSTGIGVRWAREDFGWSWIEGRGKGQFDWTVPDRVMTNASRLGVNVVAMAGYSPAWANGGRADDKYPPLKARDYADFVVALANRYGRNGTFWSANKDLRPQPVAAIEIWNEPWLWTFWKPQPDAGQYAALVRAAAPAIKAAHPEIKVLISGDLQLGYSDSRDYTNGTNRNWEHGFLARLLKHDFAAGSVDAYAVHPYSQGFGPYQATISWFADQSFAQQWLYQKLVLIRDMVRRAGKYKPLWNTEFGWSTSGDVNESTQAQYLHDALKRAVDEWGGFVQRSFVYVLEKPHNGDRDGGYNLFRDNMTPKPAWTAVERLIATGT